MIRSTRPLWHGIVVWGSLLATAAVIAAEADEPPRPDLAVAIYDRDPQHLWNRLHTALMVRRGPDGVVYGHDRLEPLLWKDSTYLLRGEAAGRAVRVLREFVTEHGESRISDSTKHALLQRDLWLIANWLAEQPDQDHRDLLDLLVKSIQSLALTPKQIGLLPDNYTLAVASRKFPSRMDSQAPAQPYLPHDLFLPDGPWVCLGRDDGRTAPLHLQSHANNPFTNSVFLIFLKLPGGRPSTLEFLQHLKKWNRPLMVAGLLDASGTARSQPNPDTPALPEGTELALVRRALLIDSMGHIVASPLTESVQLRFIRQATTPRSISDLSLALDERDRQMPTFEFQLSRRALLAGEAGGLRDVSTTRDFKTGFASHPWDEFEGDQTAARPFIERAQPFVTIRQSCLGCHVTASLHGTMSFQRYLSPDEKLDDHSPLIYPVSAAAIIDVEAAAIRWKEQQPGWLAIRRMLID